MQTASENANIMVGMDQCRISSIESTTSSLLEGGSGGGGVPSARNGPHHLYTQKSRGSHSSAGSCGCPDDIIPGGIGGGGEGGGCGVTDAEPLLPPPPPTIKGSSAPQGAHVNKLHFELFDQCHEEEDTEEEVDLEDDTNFNDKMVIPEPLLGPEQGPTDISDDDQLAFIRYRPSSESPSNFNPQTEPLVLQRLQNASNDTVCTSSSSSATTAATITVASSKSSGSRSANIPGNTSNRNGRSNNNRNKRLRHLSTDTDEASEISATLEPPDGGWGWVVVAASFLVNLIADGVTFSFGVFFMEFTTYFKQSESVTALIGSLLAAMPLLSGPIASWLTDRYGCRKVTIVGGLLATLGFLLSSFTTSIYVLMITFGVITGFGLSLCYVAAVVIVAYYFERRRSFATGLSVCGGGIGTFLFAPITQHLIESYGWQTTTQVLAATFLILCLCGLLMKDLEWTKRKNKSSNNNNSNSPHNLSHHNCNGQISCSSNYHHHHQSSDKSNLTLKTKNNNRRCNSAICIPTFVQEQERRERRQRYYSYNQQPDVDVNGGTGVGVVSSSGGGGLPIKQDLIVTDRSGGNKRTVKTRLLPPPPPPLQNPDSNDLLLDFGPSNAASTSSADGSSVVITSTKSSIELPLEESPLLLLPPGGGVPPPPSSSDLNIIPEEKDTNFKTQSITAANDNLTSDNSTTSTSAPPPNPQQNDSILLNLNNNNINNNLNKTSSVITPSSTSTTGNASSSDLRFNHIYQQNNFCNDSNNSSINNVNNINNSLILSNGIVRNNNNSVSSFTSATIMPSQAPAPQAPNGIPTIIIPPAQQSSKQSSNAKLDIMNSARYRSVMHRHSLTYRGAVLNLKRYRLRSARSCPDIISVATSVDGRSPLELNVCYPIGTRFLLFILSNLLLYTCYDVPYMYLQTAAVRQGYSDNLSSYLISSIGLSNVVGNIILGYMGDKEWASATLVYGVCMIICGGTTVLMPYLMEWNYWGLFIICGVFGLTIAANYALTSVILVQVVSLERFASAYGFLLMIQGIGNLVGPPIAGMISDKTGTNTLSFVLAGVGIFASSFFVLAPVFYRELEPEPSTNNDHHQNTSVGHHHHHHDRV